MINEELLKLAIKAIEEEPGRWEQGCWAYCRPKKDVVIEAPIVYLDRRDVVSATSEFGLIDLENEICGTTMCLAGHIVTQAGYPILVRLDEGVREDLAEYPNEGVEVGFCLDDGRAVRIEDKATKLLGIDKDVAHRIFSGSAPSNLEDFKEYITEATGVEFE